MRLRECAHVMWFYVGGDTLCSLSGSLFYFWVTTRIDLHVLMIKNDISFLIMSSAAARLPPLSEMLCFSACLFKAPPPEYPVCSEWSAHTCLSQHQCVANLAC